MSNSLKRVAIVVAALLPVAVLGWFVLKPSDTAAPATITSSTPASKTPSSTSSTTPAPVGSAAKASVTIAPASGAAASATATTSSTYKDGTFSATVSYGTPGGPQDLGVTVTLKSDVITDVSVTEGAKDAVSQKFQDDFVAGYKTLVVGKKIEDVQLTKVSGSSLTPKGFNDALSAIKVQAAA